MRNFAIFKSEREEEDFTEKRKILEAKNFRCGIRNPREQPRFDTERAAERRRESAGLYTPFRRHGGRNCDDKIEPRRDDGAKTPGDVRARASLTGWTNDSQRIVANPQLIMSRCARYRLTAAVSVGACENEIRVST